MTGFGLALLATILSEFLTRPAAKYCFRDIVIKIDEDGGKVPASASENWGIKRISRSVSSASAVPSFMLTMFALSAVRPVRDSLNGLTIPALTAIGISILLFYARSGRATKLQNFSITIFTLLACVIIAINIVGIAFLAFS